MKKSPYLYIGLPVYGGYDPHFTWSLLNFVHRPPVSFSLQPLVGDSLVARARNRLASEFMRNDLFTHLLFLDTDLVFSPEHIARLVSHDLPIVAGLYPKKQAELGWVCNVLDAEDGGPGKADPETGLHEVKYAGTGCLLIAREVLEAMADRWPELRYDPDAGEMDGTKWDFFSCGVHHDKATGRRRYLSEDWWFCQRARDLGYKIMMDTRVVLKHVGQAIYPLQDLEPVDATATAP